MHPEGLSFRRGLSAIVALVAASACDPCAPTFGCEGALRATLIGQVVDPVSGLPIANADLTLQRIGGVATAQSSASTRSAIDGSFELSLPADETGDLIADVSIQAPGRPPYVVGDVSVRATDRNGDATVMKPWVGFEPEFPVVIAVRDPQDVPIGGSGLVFRRTGGVRLLARGMSIDSVSGTIGPDGFLRLMQGITTDTTGNVTGDFIIRLPSGSVRTLTGQQITALPDFHWPHGFIVLRVPR